VYIEQLSTEYATKRYDLSWFRFKNRHSLRYSELALADHTKSSGSMDKSQLSLNCLDRQFGYEISEMVRFTKPGINIRDA